MQIRVERLRGTLKLLQPVVSRKKVTLEALKYVLLKDGRAIATDIDQAVSIELPELEGACLIPHRDVLELLKYVPGDEMLTIECSKKDGLVLFWDGGKASYGAVDPEEYPRGPQVGEAKATGMLEGDRFLPALTTAAEYCATDDARPVYVVSESGTVEASRKPDTLEAMPILLVSGDSIMVPSRF